MGANNSVPHTVVLDNPNPKSSNQQFFLNRPAKATNFDSGLSKDLKYSKVPTQISAVHSAPQTPVILEKRNKIQAETEKSDQFPHPIVLPAPTIHEMCADALINKPAIGDGFDKQRDEDKNLGFLGVPDDSVNVEMKTDGKLRDPEVHLRNAELEATIRKKSEDMEKYYFEKVTKDVQEIIGASPNWQAEYAKELGTFKADLLQCYRDNMGQLLNCAKLCEEYTSFVQNKRLDYFNGANADPSNADNNHGDGFENSSHKNV